MTGAGIIIIVGAVVATYLFADVLDATDEQLAEIFGDVPRLPEGLAATQAKGSAGRSGEAHVAAIGTHQTSSVRTSERGAD